ncbi:MAG: hypothetical protein ACRD3F_01135, partial [Acidobacteriaceae bacterium]
MHISIAAGAMSFSRRVDLIRCAGIPAFSLSRRKFLRSSLGMALIGMSPLVRAATRIGSSQALAGGSAVEQLNIQFSVGHRARNATPVFVRLLPSGGVTVDQSSWQGTAGAGHIATQAVVASYPKVNVRILQGLQAIWAYLISHSDPDTVRRLTGDPAWRIDPRTVRVECNAEGTSGFTVTIDQLLRNHSIWVPALDMYIACGESPIPFSAHLNENASRENSRVLDEVQRAPEATYDQFTGMWEDMGNPAYTHPRQEGPGHIVCLSWDSTIAKFGIDRGAGVWNDYGNPDHFRFWFGFGNLAAGIVPFWKSQSLTDGLPVIKTVYERDRILYEVEQFSFPLNGPPERRTGDIPMLLLQRVKVTNLSGASRALVLSMVHQRAFPADEDNRIVGETKADRHYLLDEAHHSVVLALNAPEAEIAWAGASDTPLNWPGSTPSLRRTLPTGEMKGVEVTVSFNIPASGSHEFFVTLPSQVVRSSDRQALDAVDYAAARAQTLKYWSDYVNRGATFEVPERAVNDLFRANLWHARRLPRLHSDGTMDLPFSNFAYGQTGTPWPINQAVYVDYMLYGLRGYDAIAAEEITAIYHNNQEFSGHLNGNADWLAYTPGMLYGVARNFLLSGDRKSFQRVMSQTLKALDYTLNQVRSAASQSHLGDLEHV